MKWAIVILFILIFWESSVSSRRYKDLNQRVENLEQENEDDDFDLD
jgi:hypothetical protein